VSIPSIYELGNFKTSFKRPMLSLGILKNCSSLFHGEVSKAVFNATKTLRSETDMFTL
jgi:hypothetical protein